MRGRTRWVVSAVLLVLGAAAGAGAVREHWLSCRGTMLSGSVIRGFAYGPDFSEACLVAMDNGFSLVWPDGKDPWRPESAFGVACALLLASAWAVIVLTHAWSRVTRLLAAPPAVLTAAAGLITASGRSSDALDSVYVWLLVAVNVTAVVAFVVIAVREEPGPKALGKVALVLLASSAVGFLPSMADYALMTSFSDANWDTPPGSGYPTVVAVALLALGLLMITGLADRSGAADEGRPRRTPERGTLDPQG